jgi:nicotinate-nucleotide adenylyltransferase
VTDVRLGVVGGTFDPIHLGHLVAGEEARVCLGLDLVLYVPAGEPPHKRGRLISPTADRVRMVELAIASNPYFRLSLVDVERSGPSYTIDTLARLQDEWGPDAELVFIMGTDSLADLLTWFHPERLVELARVVAVTRPGTPPLDLDSLAERLPESRGRVDVLPIPAIGITSSDLRARVMNGLPIKYQVPEDVEQYIHERGLYRAGVVPGRR